LLLFVCAVVEDVGGDDVAVDAEPGSGATGALQFFGEYLRESEVLYSRAAVLLRRRHTQQALLTRLPPRLPGDDAVGNPLGMVRFDIALDESSD
jgi:hypothetical protein